MKVSDYCEAVWREDEETLQGAGDCHGCSYARGAAAMAGIIGMFEALRRRYSCPYCGEIGQEANDFFHVYGLCEDA